MEKYEFKTKLREINDEKKSGKPKKEKKAPEAKPTTVEPKPKVKFEGTEPKPIPQAAPVKASPDNGVESKSFGHRDPNFVTRDEFEYLVSKVKKIKGKYKQIKRDIYEYEDVPISSGSVVDFAEPTPVVQEPQREVFKDPKPAGLARFASIQTRHLR